MREWMDKLELFGADLPGAMERLLGDVDLYERCIRLLLEDDNFPGLVEAVAQQDASAAFDCAHALKGVTANLGLTPLYDAVCAAVEPLRRGELTNLDILSNAVMAWRDALGEIFN